MCDYRRYINRIVYLNTKKPIKIQHKIHRILYLVHDKNVS